MQTKLPSISHHILNCMECHFLPSRLGHEKCNIKYLKIGCDQENECSTTRFGEKW
jgi:hypothetical protein